MDNLIEIDTYLRKKINKQSPNRSSINGYRKKKKKKKKKKKQSVNLCIDSKPNLWADH